jgi:hypothetical protein
MAKWVDYASLIQLGAGLNFAYAGLEVLLEKPLLKILDKNKAMIETIKAAIKSGKHPAAPLRFFDYSTARDLIDATSGVMKWISSLNPYIATLSGFAATGALFFIAANSDIPAEAPALYPVIFASFGWFCTTVLVMGFFRLLLAFGVPKALKSI